MEDRYVTHVVKNADGDVVKLGNPKEAWSPRNKADVIADIESRQYKYLAGVEIHVVHDPDGMYLRTVPDGKGGELYNLDNLPELVGAVSFV
jgi:hypothetical protein